MISIIVPIYNVKDYMQKAVESVISQTYRYKEIVLVDDGSIDGSEKKCDEYAKKYSFIKVVHKKNGGLSSARNAGIDVAEGDFLMFLDGDDYLALNALEKLMYVQENTNADIIQYGYNEVKGTSCDDEYIDFNVEYELIVDKNVFFERLYEIGGEAASACTKLYKRKLFDELRFKEGILHEDEYMATRMLPIAESIAYTNIKPYFYVSRGNSIINSPFRMDNLDIFHVRRDRIYTLKRFEYDDLIKLEYEKYFSDLMNYYCMAKISGNKEGCNAIIALVREYKKYDYKPSGRNRIFYTLCCISPNFVNLYYLLRKCFGHL